MAGQPNKELLLTRKDWWIRFAGVRADRAAEFQDVRQSFTVEAYMANDPNYMAAWPENAQTFEVQISGDTMLWKPGGLIGLGETVILRRVG